MSGYCPCACRDCFDVAISSDDGPALCHECKDAGCAPCVGDPETDGRGHDFECQREPELDEEEEHD